MKIQLFSECIINIPRFLACSLVVLTSSPYRSSDSSSSSSFCSTYASLSLDPSSLLLQVTLYRRTEEVAERIQHTSEGERTEGRRLLEDKGRGDIHVYTLV